MVSVGALIGTLIAGLSAVFATRGDLMRVEKEQLKLKGEVKLQDFRIKRVEVRLENVESIARRTDTNVEKLLTYEDLAPAPAAIIKPLPYSPQIETMEPGD
jgi:hypothetical protein